MPYLLLVHMLCAVALIGAITHQTLGILAPVQKAPRSFFARFRAVNGAGYVNAIIVLFVVVNILGWIIYPNYRIGARINMTDLRLFKQVGTFELKENMMALALAMLPFYWWMWQPANATAHAATRKATTILLAAIVWYGFLIGHYLNNISGII
ncbi:MAG TPA: hypothetical protein VG271_19335 [Beijerinckiaceae bacterium]|nr:hypothetical protein [Beijerinckiaceae bacterium]